MATLESTDTAGSFIRHSGFALLLNANDGTKLFAEDATFCPQAGLNGQSSSFRSWSFPTRFFRHYANVGYIASNGGVHDFDNPTSFNDDRPREKPPTRQIAISSPSSNSIHNIDPEIDGEDPDSDDDDELSHSASWYRFRPSSATIKGAGTGLEARHRYVARVEDTWRDREFHEILGKEYTDGEEWYLVGWVPTLVRGHVLHKAEAQPLISQVESSAPVPSDRMDFEPQLGRKGNVETGLGVRNEATCESDIDSQANLTVTATVTGYFEHMQPFAEKVKLCSPAVTNGGGHMGLTWLKDFLMRCASCTIDFVSIHWYSGGDVRAFKDYILQKMVAMDQSGLPSFAAPAQKWRKQ
ncbi:glycoside hydrolase family 128 protein [Cadophora sp. DSE1049]|nr:glycoside hydrolase family 128 protein [Cadophora sp. DSE1049]